MMTLEELQNLDPQRGMVVRFGVRTDEGIIWEKDLKKVRILVTRNLQESSWIMIPLTLEGRPLTVHFKGVDELPPRGVFDSVSCDRVMSVQALCEIPILFDLWEASLTSDEDLESMLPPMDALSDEGKLLVRVFTHSALLRPEDRMTFLNSVRNSYG